MRIATALLAFAALIPAADQAPRFAWHDTRCQIVADGPAGLAGRRSRSPTSSARPCATSIPWPVMTPMRAAAKTLKAPPVGC